MLEPNRAEKRPKDRSNDSGAKEQLTGLALSKLRCVRAVKHGAQSALSEWGAWPAWLAGRWLASSNTKGGSW